jgi:hypothetical protein
MRSPVRLGDIIVANAPQAEAASQPVEAPVHARAPVAQALANDGVEMRGVGLLLLRDSEGFVRVMGLAQGSPAERCGRIQKGDILAEVDGVIVYKQPLEKCEERISGPWYSHVELVFYGNEENSFKYRVQLQRLATLQVLSSIPEPQFADRRSYEDGEGLHHAAVRTFEPTATRFPSRRCRTFSQRTSLPHFTHILAFFH